MLIDPVQYWQELTENYRQMGDEELRELAANPEDLTEVARQVLRDEMKRRGLDKKQPHIEVAKRPAVINQEPVSYRYATGSESDGDNAEGPHEYTWKTLLCECETDLQAWQLAETLRRAGIESWIQAPGNRKLDLVYPRVSVAADQLEQARAIAVQPIPQEIIDESKSETSEPEEFELPDCPRCGANDPVLEGTEPVNAWLCEACGAEWSDPEVASDEPGDGEKSSSAGRSK
jgi:hypothetical protein